MGYVIGPVHLPPNKRFADWFTLRELHDDLKYMRSTDPERFSFAIDKETELYTKELSSYAQRTVA